VKYLSKLTLVFLFGSAGLFAQAPDTAWTRTYGGGDNDRGYSVRQTTDGGYIIAGRTLSYGAGEYDIYLVKTNSSGDTLWTRTYGGTDDDEGYSVQQTSDGGYIIAGCTGGDFIDAYLIKTDSEGDTLWTRTYGGATRDEETWSVQQTSDGGYIIVGWTGSYGAGMYDVYLIKTNSSGDTLWTRTYGGTDSDKGYSVQQTTDGGYIVAGFTYSNGTGMYDDVYLIKTDSEGDTLWTRTYGGADSDEGFSVQQTSDGGYIVAGWTYSYGAGEFDTYLIKTNSLGDTLWTRTYGGTHYDKNYSVQQTIDGGYIVAGFAESGGRDVYLLKTDSLGDTLWTRTYGGAEWDEGYSVQQTSDEGYIVTGYISSLGITNVYLVKIKPEGSGIEEKINTGLLSLFPADPNPFTTKTTIRYELVNETNVNVSICNMLGQKVKDLYSGRQSPGTHYVTWNGMGKAEKLPSGIYFLKIKAGGKETSTKIMLLR